MRFKIKNLEIYIEYMVIIVVLLNIFPECKKYLENYYTCFLFILFHELSHVFIASLFGIKTKRLSIRLCGLNIAIDDEERKSFKWILIYLAGPMSNLLLACMFKNIPMIYYINISLMVINLFPINPLDGYNILNILLCLLKIKRRKKILLFIRRFVLIYLGLIGVIQLLVFKNPSLFLMSIYIFIESKKDELYITNNMYQKYYKNITKF